MESFAFVQLKNMCETIAFIWISVGLNWWKFDSDIEFLSVYLSIWILILRNFSTLNLANFYVRCFEHFSGNLNIWIWSVLTTREFFWYSKPYSLLPIISCVYRTQFFALTAKQNPKQFFAAILILLANGHIMTRCTYITNLQTGSLFIKKRLWINSMNSEK